MNEAGGVANSLAVDKPFISADKSLPEITFKAVILAILITAILGAANAYLALKMGMTISASIPAAIIAMGALRFFRKHNLLENNIVQTAASAGEGLAAGIAFILPALLLTGYWTHFHYWETLLMTLIGGLLGVLFSIPLRRVMLNHLGLRFPEGTAIGNVLKASATGTARMKYLVNGSLVGGLVVLFQTGFKLIAETLALWTTSTKTLFGTTLGFSPALLAAGFIVGMQACIAMLAGVCIAWFIGIPLYTHWHGLPAAATHYDMAMSLRADHIRYIGVGTMLLGGIWTILSLLKPIGRGIAASLTSLREARLAKSSGGSILRTERDIPIHYVFIGTALLALCMFFSFVHFLHIDGSPISNAMRYGISGFSVIYVLIIGFFLASVAAYMVGIVGNTNNPISGLMLGCTLLAALCLLPIFSHTIHSSPESTKAIISIVVIITTFVATTAVISGENLQDLKAGQMVGATPWKQQIMLLIGVVVAALVIGPALELLFQAYGIGGVFPRPGMDAAQMLSAPQAGLMAAVAQSVFGNSLPWADISIGIGIAVVGIIIDELLKRRGLRLPVLAIGIGIYLPPEITTPIIAGGALNFLCKKVLTRRLKVKAQPYDEGALEKYFDQGTMLACGLVAGAALMGVILAIPFVLKGSTDALRLVPEHFAPYADFLGIVVLILLALWLYKHTVNSQVE